MKTSDSNIANSTVSISRRGREMPGSPIRRLASLAEDRKKSGIHVYHLNIGQPDIPTAPLMLEAVKNYDHKVLQSKKYFE